MKLYHLLLRMFPASFRARFGEDMTDVFHDRLRAARREGRVATSIFWVRASWDLVVHGTGERRAVVPTRAGAGSLRDSILRDIIYAWRTFRVRPWAAAMALLTLALGIGANTAIFTVVHAVLIRDLPYPEPDRIVRLYATHRKYNFDHGSINPFDFDYWQRHATSFTEISANNYVGATLTGAGDPRPLRGESVMPGFFPIVGIAPARGRVFTEDEARAKAPVVIISHKLWTTAFGGRADIDGHVAQFDDQPWTIIGVMPAGFALPESADFWRPLDLPPAERRQMGSWYLGAFARLRPGVGIEAAQQEMDRLGRDLEVAFPARRKDRGFAVFGLQADLAARSRDGLRLLQGVALVVLLIACANVANLLLAQALDRRREFSLRAAVGATRARLVRQSLTESVVLALGGAALGLVLAFWGVRALVALAPPFLLPSPETIGIRWTVLGATTLAAVVTGLLFGLAPALLTSAEDPAKTLLHGARTTAGGLRWSRRHRLRAVLIATEIALAIVLVIGAGLLVKSFTTLMRQDPGFRTDHLLTAQVTLPARRYPTIETRLQFWQALTDRLASLPGVVSAAGSTAMPFSLWEWQSDFSLQSRIGVPNNGAGIRSVTSAYFSTMGIPVVRGRSFTSADVKIAPPVAIVSDAFVREHMAGLDPIGQQIAFNSRQPEWATIVGVVGATRHIGLHEAMRPEIYRPIAQQEAMNSFVYALRTEKDPEALAPLIRSAVASLDPKLPVQSLQTMDALIGNRVAERRFYLTLLGTFAALAAALAVIGVYGVMAYVVGQSGREVAIRIALGARPSQVRRGTVAQGLRVIIVGAGLGLIAAYQLTSLLTTQLFMTEPRDPIAFATAAGALVVVATIACWIPASRVDHASDLHS